MHNPDTFFPTSAFCSDEQLESISLEGSAKYYPSRNMGNGVYSSDLYDKLVDQQIKQYGNNHLSKQITECNKLINELLDELANVQQSPVEHPKDLPEIFIQLYCWKIAKVIQIYIDIQHIVNDELFYGNEIVRDTELVGTLRVVYSHNYTGNSLKQDLNDVQKRLNYIKTCFVPLYKDKQQDKLFND